MSDSLANADRLFYLADLVCDGCASDGDMAELDSILRADESSRSCYFEYCRMCATLELDLQAQQADQKTRVLMDFGLATSFHADSALATTPPPAPFPVLGLLTTAYHGTVGFFSQEVPFGILVATLVFIVGGIIGSIITVNQYTQFAGQSQTSAERSFASKEGAAEPVASKEQEKEIVFVGRITAMVDCKWSNDNAFLPPLGYAAVPLGRKYKLDSGLMEITYNTGAKVILQGPVTYEVESVNGGYMSAGKLTGKVEVEKAKGFSVRTPTAVVTDLGTEFGVEVDEGGITESHVLRGSVTVRLVAADGKPGGPEVIVRENDSVRVEKFGGEKNQPSLAIRHIAVESKKFARVIPKPEPPPPMQVLAYFRLGEDDPGAAAGAPANERTIDRGGTVHLEKHGSPSYVAAAVPGSSLAMNFTGAEGEYFFASNLGWTPDDNFILEAWVRPNRVVDGQSCIVHNGRPNTEVNNPSILDGYGLFVYDRHYEYLFGNINWSPPLAPCEPGKWTHLALVYQQRKVQFWLNGRLAHEADNCRCPIPSSGQFMIGGVPAGISTMPRSFDGQIDEVRLSAFRGTFDPKMLLWRESPERGK